MLYALITSLTAAIGNRAVPRFASKMRLEDEPADSAKWRRDPLSHPAIRSMTPHEVADLYFDPKRIEP